MMIPDVISEAQTNYDDGTYIKHVIIHAPEWNVYIEVGNASKGGWPSADKINHFLISESTRVGRLETLVFPCNPQGEHVSMIEVAGGRDWTADQVLTSFALIMMEAGYDPV